MPGHLQIGSRNGGEQKHLSNESHIVLNSVQSQSVGRYSCEVSADAPSFHTLFDSAELKVVGKFRLKCNCTEFNSSLPPTRSPHLRSIVWGLLVELNGLGDGNWVNKLKLDSLECIDWEAEKTMQKTIAIIEEIIIGRWQVDGRGRKRE